MNAINLNPPQPDGNPFAEINRVSTDIEVALLGAALTNPASLDVAAPHVDATDFSDPFLGGIWEQLRTMHTEGTGVTAMLLIARMSSPDVVANLRASMNMSPAQFVSRLGADAIAVSGAADYAKQIREFAHRRRLHAAAASMRDVLVDPMQDLRAAASACSSAIEQALNAGQGAKTTLKDMILSSVAALADDAVAPGVTTGLLDLDKSIGGLVPGDLIVLGARPSMGKSALSICIALHSALASYRLMTDQCDGEPWSVLFLTHEMTQEQVIQRMLTDLAFEFGNSANPVEYTRFRPPPGVRVLPLSETQRHGMDVAAGLLPRLPIYVDGRPGMRVSEVTALIRAYRRRCARRGAPLRAVVCDHIGLGKILPDTKDRNRVDEIGEITSALKACAVTEKLAVVACHQLSRANEGRENKRPGLADFRDSGHIEQDADVMLGVYRDSYYLERTKDSDQGKDEMRKQQLEAREHEMEVINLKCRSGRVGVLDLWAHMGANAIRNKFNRFNGN
jgi:replicative DNA helicase